MVEKIPGWRRRGPSRGPVKIRDLGGTRRNKTNWFRGGLSSSRRLPSESVPTTAATTSATKPPAAGQWDMRSRTLEAASRENARRTVRPSRAARRTWPAIAAILATAGIVVAAVLYLSNVLTPTSTVSGNPITISFDPSDTLTGSKFRNTVYDFSIRVEQAVQTSLPVSIRFVVSKSAVVCSDLVLRHNAATLACNQVDASNVQFETAVFNVAMSPSASTQLFSVQFATDGTYGWAIQARATV